MALIDILTATLKRDEGYSLVVYDDANGLPIRPGSHVIGHPTIGVGRALDVAGISGIEAVSMLNKDIYFVMNWAADYFPWFMNISERRQAVICSMIFQLGTSGFKQFQMLIAACSRNDFATAAADGMDSLWAKQTPERASRLMDALKNDTMP